jgi:hypothetical protein
MNKRVEILSFFWYNKYDIESLRVIMASKSDTKKKTTTKKATTKKASTPKKTSTKKTTTVKKNTVKKVEPVKVETKKAKDAWYKHPILVGMISIALCYLFGYAVGYLIAMFVG